MKYLQKFLESFGNSDKKLELENFCDENLAYLLDEGFEIRVIWTPNCKAWRIKFSKIGKNLPDLRDVERSKSFYWREIKDEFIPFFEMLDIKYEICATFNRDWIPTYQLDNSNELIVDFETPMYITDHLHLFYNKKKLLSGKTTNKKIKNITIYIKDID